MMVTSLCVERHMGPGYRLQVHLHKLEELCPQQVVWNSNEPQKVPTVLSKPHLYDRPQLGTASAANIALESRIDSSPWQQADSLALTKTLIETVNWQLPCLPTAILLLY